MKRINLLLATGLATSLVYASRFFKVSYIIGAHCAHFSGLGISMPLVGALTGMQGSVAVFGILSMLRYGVFGFASLRSLAFFVPGFFGSWYWASENIFIRCLLPLVCMALFLLHPVGGAAWGYTLFWLIPVVLYARKHSSRFTTALGSTFVVHGVGSVIWLYACPMTPAVWWGLIPVVALERLTFTLGMVATLQVVDGAKAFVRSYARQKNFVRINSR